MKCDHGHWALVIVMSGACGIELEQANDPTTSDAKISAPSDYVRPGDIAAVLTESPFRLVHPSGQRLTSETEKVAASSAGWNRFETTWMQAAPTDLILAEFPRMNRVLARVGSRLPERLVLPRESELGERCSWLRQLLIRAVERSEPGEEYVRANLARLILWEILKARLEDAIPFVAAWDQLLGDFEVAAACLAMLGELDESWTMVKLSREVQIPRCTLERRFRRAVGRSPAEWLRTVRISRATKWLDARDQSVESIGRQAGYQSSSGFRAAYQRTTGLSPSESRK